MITRKLHHPLRWAAGILPAGETVECDAPLRGYQTTITVSRTRLQVGSLQLIRALAVVPCPDLDENETRHGGMVVWSMSCERAEPDGHPERICAGDQTRCPWADIRRAAVRRRKAGEPK
ncbi:MAG TPA: hypothetical protein VGK74_22415 [Symbiobacteriaceae bacterium]